MIQARSDDQALPKIPILGTNKKLKRTFVAAASVIAIAEIYVADRACVNAPYPSKIGTYITDADKSNHSENVADSNSEPKTKGISQTIANAREMHANPQRNVAEGITVSRKPATISP
jgi:hypothetical protein